MKIAILAPPYLPIPPDGYGGVERIVYLLTEGLVKKGHDVTLFAPGDSKTSAKLSATFPKSIGNSGLDKSKSLSAVYPLIEYTDCFNRAGEFDLIHNHAEYYAMFLADFVKTPVVHTIHSSLSEGNVKAEKRATLKRFSSHNFVSISDSQRRPLPDINWVGTVYNGVNLEEFEFSPEKGNYLLWMGRITPKKGPVEAIEVSKKTGIPLKIVGVVDPADNTFFAEKIKPQIDGKQIELLGELHGRAQADLYKNALVTLYPISWHEPFGLVMVESMACGTPVVAFDIGSVPEIVENGRNGFAVKSVEEMVEAVGKIGNIKREDCRKSVEEKFTAERMVEGYEEVYKKVFRNS
ncbi:glycosyltransferase family 4 protein [Patescibacteria group bacterium]|nr:glycosyltransferase family 4 protein [Patescibacteria group bacterium]